MKKPAVFMDRDGTLIDERGYLSDAGRIRFYPDAAAALKSLKKAGFKLIIVTNQSGVARGYFTLKQLARVHRRFTKLLKEKGAGVDGIYFCPHGPDGDCSCRKPRPGMGKQAAKKFKIDLPKSYMVGDQPRDIQFAKNLGVKSVLVLTGGGRSARKEAGGAASKVTSTIGSAARWILKDFKWKR